MSNGDKLVLGLFLSDIARYRTKHNANTNIFHAPYDLRGSIVDKRILWTIILSILAPIAGVLVHYGIIIPSSFCHYHLHSNVLSSICVNICGQEILKFVLVASWKH